MTEKAFNRILIILLCLIIGFVAYMKITNPTAFPDETSTELAKTITVLRPSFMTSQQIESFIKGTGLAGYSGAFLEAEKQSGIGADYLISIAIHESGWGSNDWWKTWNNCFSWGVTDTGPNSEAYKIKSMTKEEAIIYIAKKIKELYLTKGGAYYSGETLSAIGKYYASDSLWASSVIAMHSKLTSNLSEDIKAKQWIMSSRILNGDLPSPVYFTSDYFTRPMTREELSIILYRINGR